MTTSVSACEPATPPGSGIAPGRLIGIDAARGLAVLGMLLVHVNPTRGPTWLVELAQGRSAALFAVLAGVSVALLSGGAQPPAELAATRWQIVVRAVMLMVLGLALDLLQTSVMVILCYYAMYFLLCLPLLRLRAPALAVSALIAAIAGPIASFAIRSHMEINEFGGSPSFASVGDLGETLKLLFLTGAYPVLTWLPFVLAGFALGRLELHAIRPMRIASAGAVLTVAGFGGSWFAQNALGGRDRLVAMLSPLLDGSGLSAGAVLDAPSFGTTSTTSWWNLTLANPHSGTPFEVIGSIGVALAAIGLLSTVCRPKRGQRLFRPLIAIGTTALTAYCLHIVILALFPPLRVEGEHVVTLWDMSAWTYYALLVSLIACFAMLWLAVYRRGPFESLLHHATCSVRPRSSE